MKKLLRLTALLWWIPATGLAADESLQGKLVEHVLVTASKNQPALAVLAGNTLYYAEGRNLDSTRAEDCPAVDLYRYDLKEKQETRIAEVPCVLNLLTNGQAAYVVTRDANGALSVSRTIDGKPLQAAPAGFEAKLKARVAFKRSAMQLPRGGPLELINFLIRQGEVNAVFKTETHLFLDAVPFDQPSKQSVLPIALKGFSGTSLALSDNQHLFSFTEGNEGWPRVVETKPDGTSTVLGHQRPLPKNWSTAGPLDWAVRTPRFLVGMADGFLVADRTPEAFTEATAVSIYSSTANKFFRIDVPDQDVGGLSYALGGVLVSKPMLGSIVWYGKQIPSSFEVKK